MRRHSKARPHQSGFLGRCDEDNMFASAGPTGCCFTSLSRFSSQSSERLRGQSSSKTETSQTHGHKKSWLTGPQPETSHTDESKTRFRRPIPERTTVAISRADDVAEGVSRNGFPLDFANCTSSAPASQCLDRPGFRKRIRTTNLPEELARTHAGRIHCHDRRRPRHHGSCEPWGQRTLRDTAWDATSCCRWNRSQIRISISSSILNTSLSAN